MCDTRGCFHGSTLSARQHFAATLEHGTASLLLSVIGLSYSSGQFWLVKITPTDPPKSRCILPTLYVYLTTDEIQTLYEFPIDIPEKRRVRDIFVLNCFTGLRHSDWSKVSFENIHNGNLYIRTQKTDEPVIIPVKPLVIEILNKYGNNLGVISLQKTNEAIRFIGQLAYSKKIKSENINKWIEIRTHTARRSFATNAYLSGIPIRDIMQITGHRTTESFLKYIKVTKLETAEKLKDHPFFQ